MISNSSSDSSSGLLSTSSNSVGKESLLLSFFCTKFREKSEVTLIHDFRGGDFIEGFVWFAVFPRGRGRGRRRRPRRLPRLGHLEQALAAAAVQVLGEPRQQVVEFCPGRAQKAQRQRRVHRLEVDPPGVPLVEGLVHFPLVEGGFVPDAAGSLHGVRIQEERLVADVPDEVEGLIRAPSDHAAVSGQLEALLKACHVDWVDFAEAQPERDYEQQGLPAGSRVGFVLAQFHC